MDWLSCIIYVKYVFSVREKILFHILVVRQISYFVNKNNLSQKPLLQEQFEGRNIINLIELVLVNWTLNL